jgi:hypothetical protein
MADQARPSRPGYRGFGSFMTEQSVEELIHQGESQYVPPPTPCAVALPTGLADAAFGAGFRRHFLLDLDR